MLERKFAYHSKPNFDQAAGIYCSVCKANGKFNRWTETLKRTSFSPAFFLQKYFCGMILF